MKIINGFLSETIGELLGTFILVFFGCGSIAVTTIFNAHSGLLQIAIIWGMGATLAIYATRHISCAHINPAVTIAMLIGGRMSVKKLPAYLLGQFAGAFLAATVLYFLFSSSILEYESTHNIIRGEFSSLKTAMIFCEYFPNPELGHSLKISLFNAFFAEMIGTFILIFFIFSLTDGCNVGRPDDSLTPLFIGLSLTLLISIIAPITQAGFNPARDLAPRLLAYISGWGQIAFHKSFFDVLFVYIIGPISGAIFASLLFKRIIEPIMLKKKVSNNCRCK